MDGALLEQKREGNCTVSVILNTNKENLDKNKCHCLLTCLCLRKSRAICTFCSLWKRIRPFSRGCKKREDTKHQEEVNT